MSVESLLRTPGAPRADRAAGFRLRIIERRRLAALDRASAELAELSCVRTVLTGAAGVVADGWIQHGWFAYRDEQGRRQLVDAYSLNRLAGRRPIGACLVGAVVQAGGGVPAAHSQPVHRALDLIWQALSGDGSDRCPAPAVRVARVRELTAWNDRPRRTVDDVLALLAAADRRAAKRIGANGALADRS